MQRNGLNVGVFFFSSRRRHTRLSGDWSSDVCSSDLAATAAVAAGFEAHVVDLRGHGRSGGRRGFARRWTDFLDDQIGRASCMERVWSSGFEVGSKAKELPRLGLVWNAADLSLCCHEG